MRKKTKPTVQKTSGSAPRANDICRNHRVRECETLDSIAAQYGITMEKIIADNRQQYPSIAIGCVEAGSTLTIRKE